MMLNPNYRPITQCKYCQSEIRFNIRTPYNNDGSIHECSEYKESRKNSKIPLDEVSPELLAQYAKGMNEHAKSKKYSVRKPVYTISNR
jgi:hypothetical protein